MLNGQQSTKGIGARSSSTERGRVYLVNGDISGIFSIFMHLKMKIDGSGRLSKVLIHLKMKMLRLSKVLIHLKFL